MYGYTYTAKSDNCYTITWTSDGVKILSADYRIVADTPDELESVIALNAIALKNSNARLFPSQQEETEHVMMTEEENA